MNRPTPQVKGHQPPAALLGGVTAARFGITAPFWAGFAVAVIVSASTWRVFNRAAVAQAYAEPG